MYSVPKLSHFLRLVMVCYLSFHNTIVFCRPSKITALNIKYDTDVVVNEDHSNATSPNGPLATLKFLRRFGYLEEKQGNNSEGLYSEESIATAIREMQKFGDLPQTGYMDNATIQLLSKPRCGVPDNLKKHSRSKRFVIGGKGWNKRHLTYRFENWSPKMNHENVLDDMSKAFSVWADYARLRFSKTSSGTADIGISFGRGYHNDKYPFDGPGGTLAHAYFPYSFGNLGGDIHFDDDENWISGAEVKSSTKFNAISFLAVATHELGHSLGLSHSHDRESVMFPYYQSSSAEPKLAYDDIMGIYQLYIQREIQPSDDYDSHEDKPTIPTSATTMRTSTTHFHAPYYTTTPRYSYFTKPTTTQRSFYTTRTTERSSVTHRPDTDDSSPELCKTSFDTISFVRNEIFVFKGTFMWRISDRESAYRSSPFEIQRLFPILNGIKTIDAVYERETDGSIVFFSGNLYWTFDGTTATANSPRPITDFGLPQSLKKVDAAFVWERNHMTYFFSDNRYWRYNGTSKSMDGNYPQSISKWTGIPDNLNAAMRWKDGKSYFFKNSEFWRLDDESVSAENGFPQKTKEYWFGCKY